MNISTNLDTKPNILIKLWVTRKSTEKEIWIYTRISENTWIWQGICIPKQDYPSVNTPPGVKILVWRCLHTFLIAEWCREKEKQISQFWQCKWDPCSIPLWKPSVDITFTRRNHRITKNRFPLACLFGTKGELGSGGRNGIPLPGLQQHPKAERFLKPAPVHW